MQTRLWLVLPIAALAIVACSDDNPPVDAGSVPDAGDAGAVTPDGGPDAGRDAEVPLDAEVPPDDGGSDDGGVDDGGVDDGGIDDGGTDGGAECAVAADCSNGDACDGAEECVAGACVAGTPLVCDDAIACTMDSCDPTTGCVVSPIDADGDGDPACTDCDDADPARYTGATEVCDGIDNDCDLVTDETVSTTYYSDCDGDMWASDVATTFSGGCVAPPVADTGCGTADEAWTTRAPTASDFDCADNDARAHSGTTVFYTTPIPDVFPEYDFDFNCDFVEEMQYPTQGSCTLAGGVCTPTTGWALATIPECGDSATFITACTDACVPTIDTRAQPCR